MPKSHLQCFGESVYCLGDDMLGKCNDGKTGVDRLAAVVGWSISTTRPLIFGVFPYNPILGETHHVSRGTLNVLLEQVFPFLPFDRFFNFVSIFSCNHVLWMYLFLISYDPLSYVLFDKIFFSFSSFYYYFLIFILPIRI